MIQKRNSFWKGVIMLKLLFITHSGSCRPPMAEFIMKSLIARSRQDDKIYASSAHLQKKKGEPLGQKERELLTKKEIPYTEKSVRLSPGPIMTDTTIFSSRTTKKNGLS